jgi:Electron transfer DM13
MKNLFLLIAMSFGFLACTKTTDPTPATTTTTVAVVAPQTTVFDTNGQKLLAQGTFQMGVHTVTGNVKVYQSTEGKRNLVFENFKTDAGPDLRIWIAQDTKASGYIEITDKVISGNFYLSLASSADIAKQPYILVWCKSYTVLFGSAKLM